MPAGPTWSPAADPPHATAQGARRDRDTWELKPAAESRARGVPLLGICRGMQVMAVEAGARLEQHVPDRTGTTEHSIAPGTYGRYPVDVLPDTQLARILGAGTYAVPTYHHQAVDPRSLEHTAYRATAWHADGTLEAMEEPDGVFRLAVQWHPEAGEDNRLFRALVEAAREAGRPAASLGRRSGTMVAWRESTGLRSPPERGGPWRARGRWARGE